MNQHRNVRRARVMARVVGTIGIVAFSPVSASAQELVHRWSFDTLEDSVGNADITLHGNASLASGELVIAGGPVRTNYASMEIGETIASTGSLTVETWFTMNSAQEWSKLWMFGTDSGGYGGTPFMDFTPIIPGGLPSIGYHTVNGAEITTRGEPVAPSLPTGVAMLATVVFDDAADQIRLYRDGQLIDSVGWAGTISQLGNTAHNFIGAPVYFGDGSIDARVNEMRVWTGALTDAHIAANAANGPATPAVHDPRIDVPAEFSIETGGEAGSITIPITNLGTTGTLQVTGVTITGPDADFFTTDTTLPLVIAPGGEGSLELGFNFDGWSGEFGAQVEITSNDPFSGPKITNIAVKVALPDIEVPAGITQGPVANDAAPQTFTALVQNVGQGELILFDAEFISGNVAPTHFQQFKVVRDFIEDGPLYLAPGESTELEFTFDPSRILGTLASGYLEIESSDYTSPVLTIPVTVELQDSLPATTTPVLEHRWSFASDASDSEGGATAELLGETTVSGGSLVLPGGGLRTNMASIPVGLTFARSRSLTIEAWVTPASEDQMWRKIWMFGTPSTGPFAATYIDFSQRSDIPNQSPSLSFRTPGRGEVVTRGEPNPPMLPANVESHLVAVYDSENDVISLYRDGTLIDSVGWIGEMHELGITTENYIGAALLFGDADWGGTISEFRIWNGALSATQVASSRTAGTEVLPDLTAPPAGDGGLAIAKLAVRDGQIVLEEVSGLRAGVQYHLETGTQLNDFVPVAGSTFSAGGTIPTVPAVGPRRFVRIVEGAAP
ncbi:choice-of-anchor D domain-containing protein [Luteolibacter flavescens]|uniref:Choice-of-anchor D domain-containing protein n=1 Tax=Luteolibacter flavescens TaxID=1859460 RepID=A0ABT3FHZ6_9BACT|nr:LamG-like jellyroll fold domain-containing protein [Luteolibacter flavescens]MCW1883145.1 choice-of-anchor D domain-containing protein [Luteolibacter flavescens]